MAQEIPPHPLREERDIRDYDPGVIRHKFDKMLYPNKARERSKQLDLWEAVTLASYYEKLMGSTRPRNVRRAVNYEKELDVAADRIDAVIETLGQITNEIDTEICSCATDFKKSWVTEIEALENGICQLSATLQKQSKSLYSVAQKFTSRVELISGMRDNYEEHQKLLKKCRAFGVSVVAFTKLVRVHCGKAEAPTNERWSVEDLKTLPDAVKELGNMITNLDALRAVRKLIEPTDLPKENDIASLIQQAQTLRRIFEVDKLDMESPIETVIA